MKFKFNKVDIHEFHEKFAWIPVKVDDEESKTTVVVFEKYMRRCTKEDIRKQSKDWEQYSKKEYFKKKLQGDFEKTTGFAEMSHDGTDTMIQGAGSVSLRVESGLGDVEVWDEQGNVIQTYKVDENGNKSL